MFGIFNKTKIPALEQTLSFSQKRHELLAGNFANVDTPGNRAKDLDVGDLQNALAESIDTHQKVIDSGQPLTRGEIRSGPRDARNKWFSMIRVMCLWNSRFQRSQKTNTCTL